MNAGNLFCWLAIVSGILPAASVHAADLREAVSQLEEWQKRVICIRVLSRVTSDAATNAVIAESKAKTAVSELDFVWDDSGRFRDADTLWHDGVVRGRGFRSADRQHYYACGFPPAKDAADEFPTQVSIQENSIQHTSMKSTKQPFWVLWDDGTRTWLADRLRNVSTADTTAQGLLQIDGALVGMLPGYVVWLDPKHGYLPSSARYEYGTSYTQYQIDEFQEVEPGFWFPRKGTIDLVVENKRHFQSWEITKVELNPELPDSFFVPPMNRGTYIVNAITGQQYRNYPGAAHAAAASTVVPVGSLPANSSPLTAQPERSTNWSLWLTVVGVLLVALAVWLRRRA
jgi:hypothetical protein